MKKQIAGGFKRMVQFLVRASMMGWVVTCIVALLLVIIIGLGGMP